MADAGKLMEEGEILMNQLEFDKARKKFNKALKEEESARGYFDRAEASLGITKVDTDEILEDYEKAIEMDENPFYLEAAASFCIDAGKFEKAEEYFRKAAEIDDENRANYLAELAVGYRFKAPIMMEKFLAQGGEEIILRKSLNYMLEALDIDREKALELLK